LVVVLDVNRESILKAFPDASESFIRANLGVVNTVQPTVVESSVGDRALEKKKTKKRDIGRFLVRVESVRKRLLDEDNLCEKYHVDLCRYAGIIPDDAPGRCQIEVRQRKAEKGEAEKVNIAIYKLN
jgi:hypothetical protein